MTLKRDRGGKGEGKRREKGGKEGREWGGERGEGMVREWGGKREGKRGGKVGREWGGKEGRGGKGGEKGREILTGGVILKCSKCAKAVKMPNYYDCGSLYVLNTAEGRVCTEYC